MQAAALGRLSVFFGKAVVVCHLKSALIPPNPNAEKSTTSPESQVLPGLDS